MRKKTTQKHPWTPQTPYDWLHLLQDDHTGLKESWLRDRGYLDDDNDGVCHR